MLRWGDLRLGEPVQVVFQQCVSRVKRIPRGSCGSTCRDLMQKWTWPSAQAKWMRYRGQKMSLEGKQCWGTHTKGLAGQGQSLVFILTVMDIARGFWAGRGWSDRICVTRIIWLVWRIGCKGARVEMKRSIGKVWQLSGVRWWLQWGQRWWYGVGTFSQNELIPLWLYLPLLFLMSHCLVLPPVLLVLLYLISTHIYTLAHVMFAHSSFDSLPCWHVSQWQARICQSYHCVPSAQNVPPHVVSAQSCLLSEWNERTAMWWPGCDFYLKNNHFNCLRF
jgi:hypothetical protein